MKIKPNKFGQLIQCNYVNLFYARITHLASTRGNTSALAMVTVYGH